jgi:hypothetical protein
MSRWYCMVSTYRMIMNDKSERIRKQATLAYSKYRDICSKGLRQYLSEDNRFPFEDRIASLPHLRFRSVSGWTKSLRIKCVNEALFLEVKRYFTWSWPLNTWCWSRRLLNACPAWVLVTGQFRRYLSSQIRVSSMRRLNRLDSGNALDLC